MHPELGHETLLLQHRTILVGKQTHQNGPGFIAYYQFYL